MKEHDETKKQLNNAKKIIKMIYDLREKKIVTMALNKSRTASSLIDTSGLHQKEAALFKDLVEMLDHYRGGLLQSLIDGKGTKIKARKTSKKGDNKAPAHKIADHGMQLVRFLDDVEEFVDPSMNKYGPFKQEEMANLPKDVAEMLTKKNKVQAIKGA